MSETFSLLPWWISLPMLAGGCVLTLIIGFAAFTALAFLAEQAWHGSVRLTGTLAALFVNVTMAVFDWCVALFRLLVSLLLWPLMLLWENTVVRALDALALKAELFRQRQQLWHLWQRDFRDQFRTFAEFVAAFEGRSEQREEPRYQDDPRTDRRDEDRRDQEQRKQDQPRPPPDPQRAAFIAACRMFGLPETGEFTLIDLKARYRTLISKAHPDRAGHSGSAASINAARELIKQRKGWT